MKHAIASCFRSFFWRLFHFLNFPRDFDRKKRKRARLISGIVTLLLRGAIYFSNSPATLSKVWVSIVLLLYLINSNFRSINFCNIRQNVSSTWNTFLYFVEFKAKKRMCLNFSKVEFHLQNGLWEYPFYFKMVIAVKFVTWDNIIWVKKRKKAILKMVPHLLPLFRTQLFLKLL